MGILARKRPFFHGFVQWRARESGTVFDKIGRIQVQLAKVRPRRDVPSIVHDTRSPHSCGRVLSPLISSSSNEARGFLYGGVPGWIVFVSFNSAVRGGVTAASLSRSVGEFVLRSASRSAGPGSPTEVISHTTSQLTRLHKNRKTAFVVRLFGTQSRTSRHLWHRVGLTDAI